MKKIQIYYEGCNGWMHTERIYILPMCAVNKVENAVFEKHIELALSWIIWSAVFTWEYNF